MVVEGRSGRVVGREKWKVGNRFSFLKDGDDCACWSAAGKRLGTKLGNDILGEVGWDGRNTGEELIFRRTIPLGPDSRREDGTDVGQFVRRNLADGWNFLSAESEGREEWNNMGTHEITLSFCENYTNWVWINKYHDKLNKEAKKKTLVRNIQIFNKLSSIPFAGYEINISRNGYNQEIQFPFIKLIKV